MKDWMAILIQQLLHVISPALRDAVVQLVKNLDAQAKKTPNPWDDIFVGILKYVVKID